MRDIMLRIPSFDFISFLVCDIKKSPNKHVIGHVEGLVPKGKGTDYVKKHRDGDCIDIFAIDEQYNEKQIMHALITDISVVHDNDVERLSLDLISLTEYTDINKVDRSYQNEQSTYFDVVGIMAAEGRGNYLIPTRGGDCIRSMYLQYKETDWEFAKRIASRLNTVVIPNYVYSKPSMYIGLPAFTTTRSLGSTDFKYGKDLNNYRDNKLHGVTGVAESDYVFFETIEREIFDLAEPVIFNGVLLYVYSIHTYIEGAELKHKYVFRPAGGFKVKELFSTTFIGAEIDGKITNVKQDVVKVQLSIDQRVCDDKWFPYDTVYSSPDGTGWYFQPEIGDAVRLQIPCEHEEEAHVVSAVHMDSNATRENPDNKSITTKYGKAIVFEPTGIHITNGTDSSFSLIDGSGIKINTSKNLIIQAGGSIQLIGDENIFIQSDANIILDQAGNQLKVDENIDLTAGHVRLR